jgi:cytochrome c oxidase subunit 2
LADGTGLGPSLLGVYGQPVKLTTGQTITADDAYVRQHMLNPKATTVFGYHPIMPSFQGQLTEEQLNNLVAYIRALGKATPAPKEAGKQ